MKDEKLAKPTGSAKKKSLLTWLSAIIVAGCAGVFYQQSYTNSHEVDFRGLLPYAKLSELAYGTDSEIRNETEGKYFSTTIIFDPKYESKAVILKDTDGGRYIIATRGTANLKNALTDGNVRKIQSKQLDDIRMHAGFFNSSEALYSKILPVLDIDYYAIEVTGHSLGGAQALVLGMMLSKDGRHVTKIVTFGQPKVTDINGVKEFDTLNIIRVINKHDIVPLVPSAEFVSVISDIRRYGIEGVSFFRHLGPQVVLLDSAYYCYVEKSDVEDAAGLFRTSLWANLYREKKDDSAEDKPENYLDILKDNLPDHKMDNYVAGITAKLEDHSEVPLRDMDAHIIDDGGKK